MLVNSMSATILSVLMLAGLSLAGGGGWLLVKKPGNRKQAWLMVLAAVVMFANVAIWAVPI